MSLQQMFSGMQISSSGLAAERMRMEVVANNIANAHTTRGKGGGPYRRQQVGFAAAMDNVLGRHGIGNQMRGVQVLGIREDTTALPVVYDPGHPDANPDGYVQMPNVHVAHEMVDMVTASRAYEANLKSLQTFRELAEQALSLLRGVS